MAQRNLKRARAGAPGGGEGEGAGPAPAAHPGPQRHLPNYETVALMLQGGGALGAYQAGVFQGLYEAGIEPNWLAGISIGALNTAIIAGNPPEKRVERLLQFWETICQPAFGPPLPAFIEHALFNSSEAVRKAFTATQAMGAIVEGQKGFFVPRFPPPLPTVSGPPQLASYYDTTPLKATLEALCDFDRINSGEMRVSVGAVNCGTGNFAYFDNRHTKLRPEHFMASGALPPGFAAVEIDGQYYWDGGLMSNTPLYEVIQTTPRRDTLAFQVDLWSAIGPVPDNITDVQGRMKDIQYSSRTRLVTDMLQRSQRFRHVLREVLDRVPSDQRDDPWCKLAEDLSCSKRYNVIHLIYRQKEYEGHFKDFQFGLSTMREHWSSGLEDIRHSLAQPDWLDMPDNDAGFVTHDIHRDAR
ncbi:patatin-like phospholipase family protein [Paraburkholderia fungorum]|jgi:NTE family protein|uniref:NTE family protein n=1 Tax=Paraburkholderia fungorum TaxID=134537 RepID=A0AAJ3XPY2_9BURK|nr:patatin-like phospholipase family protein [Paraburkholderia fungorum]KFX60825.1 membrane protein [Burkholderia sp. K24]AJZ57681.1 patatin-like phospholipase family protein [Paraburkholderia fungorum]MBB4519010.1 NTE family protein [Paraburkholderia fungorum]MBB5546945.1 NTE family protein [Paraburkholderia fungorum]MBB6206924.1 NTE family protein [Paraburkholderia fungorum]